MKKRCLCLRAAMVWAAMFATMFPVRLAWAEPHRIANAAPAAALGGVAQGAAAREQAVAGAQRLASPPLVQDISLAPGGVLAGTLMNSAGRPVANEVVVVLQEAREVTRTQTDAEGNFELRDLRGGVYQLASRDSGSIVRAWAPGTAPPVANDRLLLVSGGEVQRGQRPIGAILTDPLVLGLVVAAAIAIPLAVGNSSPGS